MTEQRYGSGRANSFVCIGNCVEVWNGVVFFLELCDKEC